MTDDVTAAKPIWRKVVDFPLIAMLIALALIAVIMFLTNRLAPYVQQVVPAPYDLLAGAIVIIVISFTVYKLIIRHLGEIRRDDLKSDNAVRDQGLGSAAHFC